MISSYNKNSDAFHHHPTLMPAKYDLVLHIGTPKAGSSALQAFLVSNREILEKAGFYYPKHGLDINQVSGGHSQQLGVKLIKGDLPAIAECLEGWLVTAREKSLCLLLSAEAFYRQAEKLKELTAGLSVKVLAYFRDPIEWIISSYNQSVKRHFNTETFEAFAKRQLKSNLPYKSGEFFKVWFEIFGVKNVLVLPYDQHLFPGKSIELSFLSVLGVPKSLFNKFNFRNKRINASYTPSALELKRLLNVVLNHDDPKKNHRIDWALQKYSDLSSETRPTAQKVLGTDLYMAFTQKFKPTNEFMKKHILNFCPEGFLEYSSPETRRLSGGITPVVSLEQVMAEAFADKMNTVQYIFQRVIRKLADGQAQTAEVRILAELLNIDIESENLAHAVFDPKQLPFSVSEKADLPERVRKVARLLERCGQYDSTVAMISQLLELPLIGAAMKTVRQQLRKK